jgi:hypothetical protein
LASQADSVELKLTVPDSALRSTVDALGMDPLDAEMRQVVFFDTADLALNQVGLLVRARRIQGGSGDTVVKLRPVVPGQLPDNFRKAPQLGVEVDVMPGGHVCSASMKGASNAKKIRKVLHGAAKIGSLFEPTQKQFFQAYAPDGVRFRDLKPLGPITILKLKFRPSDYDRRIVAELWFFPDGSRILELSTKTAPKDMFSVGAEVRDYLVTRGVDLSGEQQTKTKKALQFFASA